jgi:hypothetical protein
MSGECGSVLNASRVTMIRHAWQVQQQREARHAFYQGADRGTAKAQVRAHALSVPVQARITRGPIRDQVSF